MSCVLHAWIAPLVLLVGTKSIHTHLTRFEISSSTLVMDTVHIIGRFEIIVIHSEYVALLLLTLFYIVYTRICVCRGDNEYCIVFIDKLLVQGSLHHVAGFLPKHLFRLYKRKWFNS